MGRGRQGGLLEGLRDALSRLFARAPTIEVATGFSVAVTGDPGAFAVERVDGGSCHIVTSSCELVAPKADVRAEDAAMLTADGGAVASDDAGAIVATPDVCDAAVTLERAAWSELLAILPVSLPTSHAHLEGLRRPHVIPENVRLAGRVATAASDSGVSARARTTPIPTSRAKSEGGPVRRFAAKSRAMRVPGASAQSEPGPDVVGQMPITRRPLPAVAVEQRLAAIRAIVRRSGVAPRSLELVGVYGPVPALEPERVGLAPDGRWVRLWYPVGARCGASSLFAVARSAADGSLHAALLPDGMTRENG